MDLQAIKQRFEIIGDTPALNNAIEKAVHVANTDLSVLITGESGVGKEIFSKIIHSLSKRKHNNFIAVNCGAIPEGTIDSELFGHEKGAFTGAQSTRKGYFEHVNGGTIFLDEIGETPMATQARLLRILESGEYIKVGSSDVQKTDVRIVAATNINIPDLVREGKFREDLYYRLNTVPINIPSLRERKEDINLLFRKFAMDFADRYKTTPIQLDEEAQDLLQNYNWPGNVRELKNIAEQVSVLAKDKIISAEQLRDFFPSRSLQKPLPVLRGKSDGDFHYSERDLLYRILFELKDDVGQLKRLLYKMINPDTQRDYEEQYGTEGAMKALAESNTPVVIRRVEKEEKNVKEHHLHNEPEDIEESLSLADMEKRMIEKALSKYKGKRKHAAEELGISERTLYRKIKEYNIEE